MRNVHRYQIAFAFFLMLICSATFAQKGAGNYNFRDFQTKDYYFGLTLGYNNSNYQVFHSSEFILNDSFSIAKGVAGPGFNVSIVTNLKIGEHFDFRFLPGFSFAERSLLFQDATNVEVSNLRRIESVFVQAPFHLRFKSDPFHDMRFFVVGGFKYTYDVASNARVRQDQAKSLIKISPHDYAVEFGAGVQFFFPYFIFSPEIKFSQGISNILIYNSNLDQSRVIEKILSRAFTVSFHFEG